MGSLLAGRVKSPRAASEHFSSQNLDLADWPVWRKLIDRLGSGPAVAHTSKRTYRATDRATTADRTVAAFEGDIPINQTSVLVRYNAG